MKHYSKLKYEFSSSMWKYAGKGGWHFISLPEEMASEIRAAIRSEEEGWGRLKATVQIGSSRWDTAIWYDTKQKTYLLPVKAEVRNRESLVADAMIRVMLWL